MTYKTLVANSASQQRWSFDSSAETLLDLKQEFRSRNIPFEGLSITEGLCTKAELTRDDAMIPVSERTVNYGGESYSRVFLITNTKKNIASGAISRKELYAKVKELGLEEDIKREFGTNYTRVGNMDLACMIERAEAVNNTAPTTSDDDLTQGADYDKEPSGKIASEKKLPEVKTAPHANTVNWFYDGAKSMVQDKLLFTEDIIVLAGLLHEYAVILEAERPTLTDKDLENMLNSIG